MTNYEQENCVLEHDVAEEKMTTFHIDNNLLLEQAQLAVAEAVNETWKNRGELRIHNKKRTISLQKYGNENNKIGEATVVFVEFQNTHKQPYSFTEDFIGFTMAVLDIDGKIIRGTYPVSGKVKDNDYIAATNELVLHFCPKCNSLDSISVRYQYKGEELIIATYKCEKCDYIDYDAID